MRKADQLVVEVHFVSASPDELTERSRNLRTLLLRGARRAIQQRDASRELGTLQETTLRLDLVEK
jgi:hypothetical protein